MDKFYLLDRKSILNLLSKKNFYTECPAFEVLKDHVETLIEFINESGILNNNGKPKKGCSRCALLRIHRFQTMLVNMFSKILINLHKNQNKEELERLKKFISKLSGEQVKLKLEYVVGKEQKELILD